MTRDEEAALNALASQVEDDPSLIEWTDAEGRRWHMENGTVLQLGRSPRECGAVRVATKKGLRWQWPLGHITKVGRKQASDAILTATQEVELRARRKALPGVPASGRVHTAQPSVKVWRGPESRFLSNKAGEYVTACATPDISLRVLTTRMAAWYKAREKENERVARRARLLARRFKLA